MKSNSQLIIDTFYRDMVKGSTIDRPLASIYTPSDMLRLLRESQTVYFMSTSNSYFPERMTDEILEQIESDIDYYYRCFLDGTLSNEIMQLIYCNPWYQPEDPRDYTRQEYLQ